MNIFLIINHQVNHLSQYIQVMNNSFNHIPVMKITVSICIFVIGDDFESLIIQHGIDYCIACLLIKMLLF